MELEGKRDTPMKSSPSILNLNLSLLPPSPNKKCVAVLSYIINKVLFYFAGGFDKFKQLYPEMCETLDDGSDSEHSLSDLGFDKLKIDNSSDIQSETPLDNHLPVEILPGLFLGSKVDSENLELLSKIGVRYILNVTPNIPNCFESNGLTYMQIPISDHWSQNLAAFFPQAIEFIGKYDLTSNIKFCSEFQQFHWVTLRDANL